MTDHINIGVSEYIYWVCTPKGPLREGRVRYTMVTLTTYFITSILHKPGQNGLGRGPELYSGVTDGAERGEGRALTSRGGSDTTLFGGAVARPSPIL